MLYKGRFHCLSGGREDSRIKQISYNNQDLFQSRKDLLNKISPCVLVEKFTIVNHILGYKIN